MRRVIVAALGLALAATTTVTSSGQGGDRAAAASVPALQVTRVARGLTIPWDVRPAPGGRLLITERDSARLLLWRKGKLRRVRFPSASVWRAKETGLMSVAVDPRFTRNRRIYTCQGGRRAGGGHDVRVRAWRLRFGPPRVRAIRTLVAGIPATTGIHGGCRLLITRQGSLLVGTGDATVGTNPRSLGSLGGKTLRLSRFTGAPWPGNPFIRSASARARYVYTYGHRNVQGLAQRSDGSLWSVEHGPDRDDEVNLLRAGGDYGWNPVPGYDQSVPMTDQGLPGVQVEARWSSGVPTLATSGATFVQGSRWGALNGTLAVAALKGSRLLFFRFDSSGTYRGVTVPAALTRYGRLRSVTRLGNGDLLVTTSNGNRRDSVLRVRPRS